MCSVCLGALQGSLRPPLHGTLYIFECFLWLLFSLLCSRIKIQLLVQALPNQCDAWLPHPGHLSRDALRGSAGTLTRTLDSSTGEHEIDVERGAKLKNGKGHLCSSVMMSTVLVGLLWKHLLGRYATERATVDMFMTKRFFLSSEFEAVLFRKGLASICVQGGCRDHSGAVQSGGVLIESRFFHM